MTLHTNFFKNAMLASLVISTLQIPTLAAKPLDGLETAIAMVENGQLQAAKPILARFSEDPLAQTYLAQLMMDEDLDEAEEMIEAVLKQEPKLAHAHFIAGRIMGRQASEAFLSALSYAKKSLTAFKTAAELEPDNLEYQMGVFRFYINAPSFAGGDLGEARQIIAKIKQQDLVSGLLAEIELSRGHDNDKEQQRVLQQLLQQHAGIPRLNYEYGMWLQRQEQYQQAIEQFNIALQNSNEDGFDYEGRCLTSYQIGRTAVFSKSEVAQGKQHLNHYIDNCLEQTRSMPETHWAQFRLANLLELAGEKEQAKHLYQSLQDIPDQELQQQLKSKI